MTSGAGPSIIGRAAANIRNVERVSTDNGNVANRSGDKAACLRLLPCALRSMDLGQASFDALLGFSFTGFSGGMLGVASGRSFANGARPPGVFSISNHRQTASFRSLIGPHPVRPNRAAGIAIQGARPEHRRVWISLPIRPLLRANLFRRCWDGIGRSAFGAESYVAHVGG
jgi:hypothetical protein